MDELFEKYLTKVDCRDVEYYYPYLYDPEDSLKGRRGKSFVRLSGEFFEELFNELTNNPNCSYDTYINDIVKDGYAPKYISVLCKNMNENIPDKNKYSMSHFSDVIASRILNFFECSTAYEMFADFAEVDNKKYSCSVDFNKKGEDFYILNGMGGILDTRTPLHDICEFLENIECILNKFSQFKMEDILDDEFEVMKNKFKEDYVYSWLIRYLLLNDSDFYLSNVGIIYNREKNSIRMAPNFDLEICFTRLNLEVNSPMNIESLQFIASKYPQVFEKFMIKLREFQNDINGKTKIREIVENVIGNESENSEKLINDLQKRTNQILKLIQSFELNKEEV